MIARLLATGLGIGYAPFMPGTLASLAALPIGYLSYVAGGLWLLGGVLVILYAAGLWAAHRYLAGKEAKDPPEIVIDEICGQLAALLFAGLFWLDYLAAFLLFRFFDIVKPWPISLIDKRSAGAMDIMGDDLLAALLAGACWLAARYLLL